MKLLAAFISCLFLFGCASYKPLVEAEEKGQISSLRVISVVPQEEIKTQIQIQTAGGAGFGLLGAIVDASVNNSRAKDAEAASDPFRDALLETDPKSLINAAYENELQGIDWASPTTIEKRDEALDRKELRALLRTMPEDALLMIHSIYSLTPELEILEIDALLQLYMADKREAKSTKDNGRLKKVGQTIIRFQSNLISPESQEILERFSKIEMEYQDALDSENSAEAKIKAKNARTRARSAVRKETDRLREVRKQNLLDARIAAIEANYTAKIESAEKRERRELLQEQAKAIKEAKSEMRNYRNIERSELWLENSGEKLVLSLETGALEIGHLMLRALNETIDEKSLKSNTIDVPIGSMEKSDYRGKTIGVHLGTNESGTQDHFRLKVDPANGINSASHYSVPAGEPLYLKLLRN